MATSNEISRQFFLHAENRLDSRRIMFGANRRRVDVGAKGWKLIMALNLDISRTGDIAIVRCRGRIVFGEESDELRGVVLTLLKETKQIVLNFAWVAHIDSSGLGSVVASFISARHRGAEIKFAALSPAARQVLRTTHVDRVFEVYDSNEEAIKSFPPHPEAAAG